MRLMCSCFTMLMLLGSLSSAVAQIPSGLEPIFKGVETGRPFHAFWPPVCGQSLVGTIVIAKDPGKPQAMFETIESPDYRNSAFKQGFTIGHFDVQAGQLTRERDINVDVAFSLLDATASALKTGPSSSSLTGTQGSSQKDVNASTATADSGRSVTGADFKQFKHATITIPKLTVTYYTLGTIRAIGDKSGSGALNPLGQQTVSSQSKGWIVSRALTAESMVYNLQSDTKVDASFLAKLFAWLPGVSVRYKNDTTIAISTTAPVTLGYKLWRPGVGPEAAATKTAQADEIGIGADRIDKVLAGDE